MALNPAEYIDDLVITDPPFDDPASQADDHIRAIKKAIKQTFPGTFDGALTLTPTLAQGVEARIAALEALPDPVTYAPVMGREVLAPSGRYDLVVTGVGFEPSLVLLFCIAPLAVSSSFSMGAASVDFQPAGRCIYCVGYGSDIISGVENSHLWRLRGAGATWGAYGKLKTFDSDGFTLDVWLTTTNGTALHWVAFQ